MKIAMVTVLLLAAPLIQPVLAQVEWWSIEEGGEAELDEQPFNIHFNGYAQSEDSGFYPGGWVVFYLVSYNTAYDQSSFVMRIDEANLTVLSVSFDTLNTSAILEQFVEGNISMAMWMRQYVNVTGLPMTFHPGGVMWIKNNVTLPSTLKPGLLMWTWNVKFTAIEPYAGSYRCSIVRVNTLLPNPYSLQDQVASLESNISALTQTISSKNVTIELLKANLTVSEETIASQNRTIASLQLNVSALTQTVASQTETIGSLNASLIASEQTINSLEGRVSTLTVTVDEQNRTISSQNAQISQLQATTTSQRDTITSLQVDLGTTRTEMYVLLATTVVFLATTAYFATRKPKLTEAKKQA